VTWLLAHLGIVVFGVLSVGLAGYLVYTMLHPERY
jgi:K+-transporting ATPase KdpF subunit